MGSWSGRSFILNTRTCKAIREAVWHQTMFPLISSTHFISRNNCLSWHFHGTRGLHWIPLARPRRNRQMSGDWQERPTKTVGQASQETEITVLNGQGQLDSAPVEKTAGFSLADRKEDLGFRGSLACALGARASCFAAENGLSQ